MKKITNLLICLAWTLLATTRLAYAQKSTNTVKYQIAYDATAGLYTALVVPDYSVPNPINSDTTEKGGTAQFTIVVPKAFVITQVNDLKGSWTKPGDPAFQKLGPGNPGPAYAGLDQNLNYYVIGKAPTETNYGKFTAGTPVALFTFKGNGCFGPLQPLPDNDPFIQAADDQASLNVGNSFYSRSGQAAGGNVVPLEQFIGIAGPPAACAVAPAVADLGISKTLVGAKVRALDETLTFRLVVRNFGPDAATNIVVKDSITTGLQLIGGTTSNGTFTNTLWTIPALASGDSAVLTVTAKAAIKGISFNYAKIQSADQTDNNLLNNEALACVSIPLTICEGQQVQATVPANFANVVWFKNNQQVASGNTVLLDQPGVYTYTSSNATCPANGCCPLVVEEGSDCCPIQLCVPVTVTIIKK